MKKQRKEVVLKYLEEYKDIGHAPLSRMIYENNRDLFNDSEQARSIIRYYRGKTGNHNRKYLKESKHLEKEARVSDSKKANTLVKEKPTQIDRLFFDIETSPNIVYSWRAGYNITITPQSIIEERKIICICWKWEHEDKVHSVTWDKNQCDKKALEKFIKVANQADELVAHNGDRFDVKWLRTRCLLHRIPMAFKYQTIDTLKKAKSHFYFNSNKLDYIARFLDVGSKMETGGFDLWVNCMKGDKEALKTMVKYCEQDVRVLEDVYVTMQSYIKHNLHHGVINGGDKIDCPNCASTNVRYDRTNVTAAGTVKRMMACNTCQTKYEVSNRIYLDYAKKI